MRKSALGVLCVALLSVPGEAQAPIVLTGELHESYSGTAQVGGGRIVGAMLDTPAAPADISRVQVHLARAASGQPICLQATTRDGLYSARVRLSAPRGEPAPARLGVVSKWSEQLGNYSNRDFAVKASTGANCETRNDLPVLLSSHGAAGATLRLMVQGRGARVARFVVVDQAEREHEGTCAGDAGKVSRAFDLVCTAPLDPAARTGRSRVEIDLRDRSGAMREERLTLLWSA